MYSFYIMPRDTPGERLTEALRVRASSQGRLAKAIGVPQPTISKIVRGEMPGTIHMAAIARELDVPVKWLLDGGPDPWEGADNRAREGSVVYNVQEERGLPVIGTVSAGDGDVGPADWEDAPQRAIHWPDSWVAVKILGDSAYPVAYSGQLAIVDQGRAVNPAIHHGEDLDDLHDNMVLVQTMEGDRERAYLKRFCVDSRAPDGFVLASVNSGRSSPYLPASLILAILPVVGIIYEDPRQKRVKGRNRAVIKT